MSKGEELIVEKARVVLVGFSKEKDKYSVAKALAQELGSSFEEATELVEQIPVELIQPLPIEAAENLAARLEPSGAEIEVVPLSKELGGGRTCYRHPHKLAMAKCKVCGRLVCNLCLIETRGKLFCLDHYKRFLWMRRLRIGGTAVAVILLVLFWSFYQESMLRFVKRIMPLSTQRVAMVVFSLSPDSEDSKYFNDLMRATSASEYFEGDSHTLAHIDGWFQRQYNMLSSDKETDVIDVDIYGLFNVDQRPPGFGFANASNEDISTYVKEVSSLNNFSLSAYDYYLFVFLTDQSPVDMDFMENLGVSEGRYGIYIQPLHRIWSQDYYVMGLAHLMARMMGATVQLDEKGFPLFPEGYGQPHHDPLYPQQTAELMGCYIPVKKFTIQRISSMDEVVIGPNTAYQLGWVSSGFVRKSYAGFK